MTVARMQVNPASDSLSERNLLAAVDTAQERLELFLGAGIDLGRVSDCGLPVEVDFERLIFYWPDLDVDLTEEMIEHPDRFPLTATQELLSRTVTSDAFESPVFSASYAAGDATR